MLAERNRAKAIRKHVCRKEQSKCDTHQCVQKGTEQWRYTLMRAESKKLGTKATPLVPGNGCWKGGGIVLDACKMQFTWYMMMAAGKVEVLCSMLAESKHTWHMMMAARKVADACRKQHTWHMMMAAQKVADACRKPHTWYMMMAARKVAPRASSLNVRGEDILYGMLATHRSK
jgi:hypothetical protein